MDQEISIVVLPVFLVIGLGFCLKRTGLLNGEFVHYLNRLLYYVALPALLFYKIATADFSRSFNGMLLGCLVLTVLIIFLISYCYGWFRGFSPAVHGAFCQGAFRGNLAYVGLAVIYNGYGEMGLAVAGILLGFLVPLLNLLSVIALISPGRRKGVGLRTPSWLRQIGGNPLILASFCGVSWSFLQFPMPQVVERGLGIVTGMSLPLALLAIGGGFSFKKLKGDILIASLSTCLKIVLSPLIAGLLLFVVGIRGQELAIGVVLAGTPTAAAAYIMAEQLKGDAELSGTIIMLSTLCSLVTYTVALSLLKQLGI